MAKAETIDLLVDGGSASGGPPLGPALGPTGIPVNKVVDEINKKTAGFKGMKVPVKISIDRASKSFEVNVGSPPTSALIKKELGLEKGSKDGSVVGDITLEKLVGIAKMKKDAMLANSLKTAVKEVMGTCISLRINVEGRSPKDVFADIDAGKYDDKLKED